MSYDPDARPLNYSISDGIVLALVGLTAISLFLPALANSRYAARKTACAGNLRVVGGLLIDESMRHGNKFIPVPLTGKRAIGGIYGPRLLEQQLISSDTTALLCPGVTRRDDLGPRFVPTPQQIEAATGLRLVQLQHMAGGDFGYVAGYTDRNRRYRAIRNRSRPNFPILGDAPSYHLAGRQSANHGGRGQNIFFEDGHITFVTELCQLTADDPIRNRDGNTEHGLDADDAVLLPSSMPPVVNASESAPVTVSQPLR